MFRRQNLTLQEHKQLAKIRKYMLWKAWKSLDFMTAKGFFYRLIFDRIFSFFAKLYLTKYIYPQILKEDSDHSVHQNHILRNILQNIRDTVIGKYYRIENIIKHNHESGYQIFSKTIPIVDYDGYTSWIELSKKEKNILWPGQIHRFSASAGTTSSRKHIPVTLESMKSSRKSWLGMFAEYITKNPDSQIFAWDLWPLVWTIQKYEHKIAIADVSALLLLEMNDIVAKKYAFPVSMLLEPDWGNKRENFLQNLHPERKLTMIGITSRAYELLRFIKEKDPVKFAIVQKNLQLIVGGGVDVAPYIHYFRDLDVDYMWVYNASEGYFGYQDIINYDNTNGEAPYKFLINHGIFYEFVELNDQNFDSEWNIKSHVQAKSLSQITHHDLHKKFAVVITTNSGLLRYLIGDVVQFIDQNHRFHITWRTRQSLNLKGEELMEIHVNNAIRELHHKHIDIAYYTIAPNQEENPSCHEWIIEFINHTAIDPIHFTKEIDNLLKHHNADYKAKREGDILLTMPKITIVPPWTFYVWLQSKGKLGGQFKIPKLSNDRKNIDEILALVAKNSW